MEPTDKNNDEFECFKIFVTELQEKIMDICGENIKDLRDYRRKWNLTSAGVHQSFDMISNLGAVLSKLMKALKDKPDDVLLNSTKDAIDLMMKTISSRRW